MSKLDLQIGAPVHCKDQQYGKLANIVVDPETQEVSDLIIEHGLFRKQSRVVPVAAVEKATATEIDLDLNARDVENYVQYREMTVKEPAPAAQAAPHGSGLAPGFGPAGSSATPMVRRRLREGVAAGKEVLGRKTAVETTDRSLGYVDHVLLDSQSKKITQIVVRKGMFPSFFVVPMEAVEEIDANSIFVSLRSEEATLLPRYEPQSDANIQNAVYDALLSERTPVFNTIDPTVSEGVVHLSGPVPSHAVKRHAEELVYLIPGVVDVKNDLVVRALPGAQP